MRIGFWIGLDVIDSIGGGGAYTNRFLHLVDNYNFDEGIEICYLALTDISNTQKRCINVSQFPRFLYKLIRFSKTLTSYVKVIDQHIIKLRGLSKVLKKTGVKIVCYYKQTECIDSNFPFISNNWDIGHRSTHAFPELIYNGEFEKRDNFYIKILPKSLLTICESEAGKKELMDLTGLGAHKIRIMPIFAGGVVSINVSNDKMRSLISEIGITQYHYFYYPAQFWAHKNHVGLLKAFKDFKISHSDYKLVFSGSDRFNKDYIIAKTQEFGLVDDVVFLNFVPEEVVYSLYKCATCLVMASHFGPTNMPPIEAMELGCPVACSDLKGHREILGENAVYFNSYDYKSISDGLKEIADNRDKWVKRIEDQKSKSIFNSQYAISRFNEIVKEAVSLRENWE